MKYRLFPQATFLYFFLIAIVPNANAEKLFSFRISLNGFGPIKVGMTVREASRVINRKLEFVDNAGGGTETGACQYYRIKDGPSGLWFMVVSGSIARVDVDYDSKPGQFRTISGASIGDSEENIQHLYGKNITTQLHHYEKNGKYYVFTPNDESDRKYRLVFETVNGRVQYIRAGRLPEVLGVEGCS